MGVRFLAWLLFILCTHCLTCLGFEGLPASKFEEVNLTEPKLVGGLYERRAAANISVGLYAVSGSRGLEGKHYMIYERKVGKGGHGHKGKGSYGGGNTAHHPKANKGPASLSSSISFMSAIAVNLAFMAVLLLGVF